MSADSHDEYSRRLLEELDSKAPVTQRSISRKLGIALGLTNLLIRRFVSRGLVRVIGVKPQRVRYLVTPAGLAEKARLSHAAFQNSVERYRAARDRVQAVFTRVSVEWPECQSHSHSEAKPVLFYGTGEVAEIGYICLQQTDLRLVGAIDDQGRANFFGVPLYAPEALAPSLLTPDGCTRLIIMSLKPSEELRREIERRNIPADRVIWL